MRKSILNEINTTQRIKYRISIRWNYTYPLGDEVKFRKDIDWGLTDRAHQTYILEPYLYKNNLGHTTRGTTWLML